MCKCVQRTTSIESALNPAFSRSSRNRKQPLSHSGMDGNDLSFPTQVSTRILHDGVSTTNAWKLRLKSPAGLEKCGYSHDIAFSLSRVASGIRAASAGVLPESISDST